MRKTLFTFLLVGMALAAASVVQAQAKLEFSLPSTAKKVGPNTFYLGKGFDQASFKVVEGYAIFHPKSNSAKPDGVGGGNGNGKGGGNSDPAASCYTFLAKGAKWKTVEPWIVNPTNLAGLDGNQVFNLLSGGIDKWEAAANVDILGLGSTTLDPLTAETAGSPDGKNEIYFGSIADSGTIGVTIVWGIFSGAPHSRELVEWDQIYDDVDFDWSTTASGSATAMDFESIATHELGHSVGLGDLYTAECIDQTMYGYASEGQIDKRSLEVGDINGVFGLYK